MPNASCINTSFRFHVTFTINHTVKQTKPIEMFQIAHFKNQSYTTFEAPRFKSASSVKLAELCFVPGRTQIRTDDGSRSTVFYSGRLWNTIEQNGLTWSSVTVCCHLVAQKVSPMSHTVQHAEVIHVHVYVCTQEHVYM